jgi:hypothetical protein
MKHLKKFNENNQDLKGKECKSCNKGTYQETSLMDDLSGTLHCNKCGKSVDRYVNDFPTKPGSNEYLLITHHESGDEIHFTLVDFSLYEEINSFLDDDPMRASHSEINDILELIHKNKVKSLMCQSYVLEEWPFTGYNIVKVINLPELGI